MVRIYNQLSNARKLPLSSPRLVPVAVIAAKVLFFAHAFVQLPLRASIAVNGNTNLFSNTKLYAKRRKNEKPEDIFNNQWYEKVDSSATPDDVFWSEMERQKSIAGIVPDNLDDPLSALSSSPNSPSNFGNNSGSNSGSNGGNVGSSQKRGGNPNKWTVIDGSGGGGMGTGTGTGGVSAMPTRTIAEEKSSDAVLASFSAFAVSGNWLDEEYIEQMRMKEEDIDFEDQDELLNKQIEDWENEGSESEHDSSDDEGFELGFRGRTSNEPWDYYRPDGQITEDDIEDEEDQNYIKIDLEKGRNHYIFFGLQFVF